MISSVSMSSLFDCDALLKTIANSPGQCILLEGGFSSIDVILE